MFLSVDTDHTDHEAIPLTLSILSDSPKCARSGIQASRDKVMCITQCKNLVFSDTEIIVSPFPARQFALNSFHSQDLDFYVENRALAHEGTVRQKVSKERWIDKSAKLLDQYCACVPIRRF